MKHSIFIFKANQNLEMCQSFYSKHMEVLAEYGYGGQLRAVKQKWMDTDGVYGIVAFDEDGVMVAGTRLHVQRKGQNLPIETIVEGLEKVMHVLNSSVEKTVAEVCGTWIAKSARNNDLDNLLTITATALAAQFGATSMLSLISPSEINQYLKLGYRKVQSVGRSGDFINPADDYSVVMLVPNLRTMEYASEETKLKILSIRETPILTITNETYQEMCKEIEQYQVAVKALDKAPMAA